MYIATRSFRVKGDDGKYRNVKPGDPVPEADDWHDRKAYVERRWICLEEDYDDATRRFYSASSELPNQKANREKAAKAAKKKADAATKAAKKVEAEAQVEARKKRKAVQAATRLVEKAAVEAAKKEEAEARAAAAAAKAEKKAALDAEKKEAEAKAAEAEKKEAEAKAAEADKAEKRSGGFMSPPSGEGEDEEDPEVAESFDNSDADNSDAETEPGA